MRRRLLRILLICGILGINQNVFANNDYTSFQEFDRQFNLNFGISQTTLKNGVGDMAGVSQQSYGIDVERLFNNGVWFDISGNIVTSSLNNQVNGIGYGSSAFNQMWNLGGLNAKVGYGFGLIDEHLLLTPYALVGRNTNLAASTLLYNNNKNVTNDFFYTAGIGGRVEYRINSTVDLYLDQLIAYNWDQSGPINGVMPQNNQVYTTTLGTKFNVYKQLQLGLSAFYTIYQNMAALPTDPNTKVGVYYPGNEGSFGGTISIGLTY
ncbi:MAG: hypothetical protein ACK5Z5_02105 [Neisseriaceae bacterium]